MSFLKNGNPAKFLSLNRSEVIKAQVALIYPLMLYFVENMMRKPKIKNPYFSFMIVLPNRRTLFSLRVPRWIIHGIGLVILAIILVLCYFFFFSVQTSYKLTDYSKLKIESLNQMQQIGRFNLQLNSLKNELKKLVDKEYEIRDLLGESQPNRFARSQNNSDHEKKNR